MSDRLNIRLDEEHRQMLLDLQMLLGLANISETLRALIHIHHSTMRTKVRQLRKAQQ